MRNDIDRRGKRILSAVAQCRRTAVPDESKQRGSQQAIALLLADIKAGEDSVKSESDWISEEDMLSEFGVQA